MNFCRVTKPQLFFSASSLTCLFQITSVYLYIAAIESFFFHHKLPLSAFQDILICIATW